MALTRAQRRQAGRILRAELSAFAAGHAPVLASDGKVTLAVVARHNGATVKAHTPIGLHREHIGGSTGLSLSVRHERAQRDATPFARYLAFAHPNHAARVSRIETQAPAVDVAGPAIGYKGGSYVAHLVSEAIGATGTGQRKAVRILSRKGREGSL